MHSFLKGGNTQPKSHSISNLFKSPSINRHRLSNGLIVLTLENRELPVISMYTFYKVGSRNERPGITGISHLFEHMMFNGSKKYGPKEFDRILESGGGHSNAYTSRDLTVYYEDFASHFLEKVVDLDSDRMGWLDLSEKILKSEADVVKEERRMRTDNSVYGRLEEELFAASYQCHSYRWPVIGWMSDIEAITPSDCNEFYKTYYTPNNAVLVLVGDFEIEVALELIEKYYGMIPSGNVPPIPSTVEPPQKGEKRLSYKKKAELHNFVLGYHAPEIGNKDIYVFDVIQTILTEGKSSLLYQLMVRKKELAGLVGGYISWHIDPGLFEFFVQMNPGHSSAEGEECLEDEITRLSEVKIKNDDLDRAKNILETDFLRGFQTNNGKAHRIGLSEVLFNDFTKILDVPDEYQKVSVEDVTRVMGEYFVPHNKTSVWLDID